MKLTLIDGTFSIAKLSPSEPIPTWYLTSRFFSVSKSENEISIVCEDSIIPDGIEKNAPWCLFRVKGQLDFNLTGILNSISGPLANERISIFAVSTFDTDYVLVKEENIERTIETLEKAGFIFV